MKRWLYHLGSSHLLVVLAFLGLILAVGLLVFAGPLSSGLARILGYDALMTHLPVRPSPTWAPMPTRAPIDVVHYPLMVEELTDLRLALLRRDLEEALFIWEHVPPPLPPNRVAWHHAGTRLFLALGEIDRARALARSAIVLAPSDVDGWLLLHLVSREMEDWQTASDALAMAVSLEPARSEDLFLDRWLSAVETGDTGRMAALAESFRLRYPGDPLHAYFDAKALTASGDPLDAATHLIEALEQDPHAPSILWYVLGQAYLELGAYEEARFALETAAERFYTGDKDLAYLEAPFLDSLNFSLARAYLGNGACANAEAVFRRLAASDTDAEIRGASRFDAWIEQSIRCQTPTPTLTPWIPKQIGTVTPDPSQ